MITVQELITNKSVLDVYYRPAEQYIQLANEIINQATDEENGLLYLNYVTINVIAPILFLSITTNIDVVSKDEDGLSGYDQLCRNGIISSLFENEIISDQFKLFKSILDNSIKNFEQRHINTYTVINNIMDGVLEILKGVDSDNIQKLLSVINKEN